MLMISIVVQSIGIAMLMISIVVPCISNALLTISIVVQCNRNQLAMHWNKIAYDKHSCAML